MLWFFFYRTLTEYFRGIFPRDNPKDTRFSINFFTSIGLGGLTYVEHCSFDFIEIFFFTYRDELREFLRANPNLIVPVQQEVPVKLKVNQEDKEDWTDHERMEERLRQLQVANSENAQVPRRSERLMYVCCKVS